MSHPSFELEEVTPHQTASMEALYKLYCRNFPLVDEQETPENFRLCLDLNQDRKAQSEYGPYHEFYLALRMWNEEQSRYDLVSGGLIFGVSTSREHQRHGFLCSVQAIYLFRETDEALRRFFVTRKAWIEATIVRYARKACLLPRFRQVIGAAEASRIAIFFEVNNPNRMSPEQKQTDRDLSHLHPALRYKMWLTNHTRPLAFRYVQPPLSRGQSAVEYLDLFAVESLDHAREDEQRLLARPDGERGIPGPVLAAHLRSFFCISVLKGDPEAIAQPCIPSGGDGELRRLDEYCGDVAREGFIPLLHRDDPGLRAIHYEAQETSLVFLVDRASKPTEVDPAIHRRSKLSRIGAYLKYAKNHLEEVSFLATAIIVPILLIVLHYFDVYWLDDMKSLELWMGWALFALGMPIWVISWFMKRQREQHDQSFKILRDILEKIVAENLYYKDEKPTVLLRDLLSDRAANNFFYAILLPDQGDRRGRDLEALSGFIASRTLHPRLAEIGLAHIGEQAELEAKRIQEALGLFRHGALQAQCDLTEWLSYYSCVFPVSPKMASSSAAYIYLEDFDRFIDLNVCKALSRGVSEREEFFKSRQIESRQEVRGVCLFVSHILHSPWDDADPKSLLDSSALSFRPGIQRQNTATQRRIVADWNPEAEIACGRMLTIISHLAFIMGRMARKRQVSTDLYCDCTVIIHITSEVAATFMQDIGFQKIPRPGLLDDVGEQSMKRAKALEGVLLTATLHPGAEQFAGLAKSNPASSAFFGLISDVAKGQKDRSP